MNTQNKGEKGFTLIELMSATVMGSIILSVTLFVLDITLKGYEKTRHHLDTIQSVSTAFFSIKQAYLSVKKPLLLLKPTEPKLTKQGQGKYVGGQVLVADKTWYIGRNAEKQLALYQFDGKYKRQVTRLDRFYIYPQKRLIDIQYGGTYEFTF